MSNTEQSQRIRNKKLEQLANSTLEEFEEIMKSFSEVSDLGNSEYQFVQRQDLSAEIQQELNAHLQHAAKSGDFEPFLRSLNEKVPDKKEAIILNIFLLFLGETLRTREFNLETLKRVCLLQKSLIDMSLEISSEVSNLSEQIKDNRKNFDQKFSQLDQKLDRVIESIGEIKGTFQGELQGVKNELQATIDERVPKDLGVQIKALPNIKTFIGGVCGGVATGIGVIGVTLLLLNSRISDAKSSISEAENRLGNRITQVESRLDKRITEVKTDLTKVDQQILDTLKEIQADLKRIEQKIPNS